MHYSCIAPHDNVCKKKARPYIVNEDCPARCAYLGRCSTFGEIVMGIFAIMFISVAVVICMPLIFMALLFDLMRWT